MDMLKDRRLILIGGAALALIAGLACAVVIAMRQNSADSPPPASEAGLMVQAGRTDNVRLDPERPLRCFVNGKLVGEMPVSACARRNGVATGALDVGVDSTGALSAAAPAPDTAPPPPPAPPQDPAAAESDQVTAEADEDAPATTEERACWGFSGGGWQRGPADLNLNACVQSLFAGQCVRPGAAAYGRWGDKTLRLVLGRVEIASADGGFRPLARQQGGCAIESLE